MLVSVVPKVDEDAPPTVAVPENLPATTSADVAVSTATPYPRSSEVPPMPTSHAGVLVAVRRMICIGGRGGGGGETLPEGGGENMPGEWPCDVGLCGWCECKCGECECGE